MLNRIIQVRPLPEYCLFVEFADGVAGVIDLANELTGVMFEPLRNEIMFRKVGLDEFGVVCWPNGADLAPDAMHNQLIGVSPCRA